MSNPNEIAIVGGGPAGLHAARVLSKRGLPVTLVLDAWGGRALHSSAIPSKLFIQCAKEPHGLAGYKERLLTVIQKEQNALMNEMEERGVRVLLGRGTLVSPHTLHVEPLSGQTQQVAFAHCIMATGSEPVWQPNLAPNGHNIIAPRHIKDLQAIPKRVAIIGGGATAAEMAHAFSLWNAKTEGAETLWIMDGFGALPDWDREWVEMLLESLMNKGVKLVHGKSVISCISKGDAETPHTVEVTLDGGKNYSVDMALLALGRAPDIRAATALQDRMASFEHIHWIGDALRSSDPNRGPWYSIAHAHADAEAVAHKLLSTPLPPAPSSIPKMVHTDPELAAFGSTLANLEVQGIPYRIREIHLRDTLWGKMNPELYGLYRVYVDEGSKRVLGGVALGHQAGVVIQTLHLASATAPSHVLASTGFAAPGFASPGFAAPGYVIPGLGEIFERLLSADF